MKLKSIRNGLGYNPPLCQLVVVTDDGQEIDWVDDAVTLWFRVSYPAASYLFGAFEHGFLRQISQVYAKNEPGFLNSIC